MAEAINHLVPIGEFQDIGVLGSQLLALVDRNSAQLEERHILGPLTHFRSPHKAQDSVARLQRSHSQDTSIVVDAEQRPQGIVTIQPALRLAKLHMPLPPGLDEGIEALERGRLARLASFIRPFAQLAGLNKVALPYAGPNITAWTDRERPDLLGYAYGRRTPSVGRPWTVEPRRSPDHVHKAIQAGGLAPSRTGWFDDQETKRSIPPRSTLYVRLQSEWLSSHGELKELRTGAASGKPNK